MKIVVADTGALISLGLVGHIDLIEKVLGDFYIANAVWEELERYENPVFEKIFDYSFEYYFLSKTKNYFAEGNLSSVCPVFHFFAAEQDLGYQPIFYIRFDEFSKHVPAYISTGMMNLFMANLRLKLSESKIK